MKKSLLFLTSLGSSVAATTLPLVLLTSCNKAEKHNVSVSSLVEKAEITSNKNSIGGSESDKVILTITNSRSSEIVDANLTILVGSKNVNIEFDNPLSVGTTELTFNKKTIQEKFSDFTIGKNDSFKFLLVRSGAYEVEENKLYQFNNLGEPIKLTEEEIIALDKKFLVLDEENDELHLSDKTYSGYIMSLTDDATIYLIHGNYYHNNSTGPQKNVRLTIHGICNDEGTSYADIQGYNPDCEAAETLVGYAKVELNLFNVNVLGRPNDGTKPWIADDSTGIIATPKPAEEGEPENNIEVTATNCAFSGAYMLSYHHSVYNNCTFDSTNSLKPASGGYKNNYPMYIYSGSSAEFHNCKFKSAGKAVKIFTAGQGAGSILTTNTFENCEFNLVDEPWCVEQEFPINIDCRLYTLTGVNVNITNCTMNQKWIDAKGNSVYGITDTVDGDNYYEHILLNGKKVKATE